MAKKLVYNYTFDPATQTIAFTGLWRLRSLILITNVTDGLILYNFADPSKGGSVSYDSNSDTTTLTVEFDTSSMSSSDELQILVDEPEVKIDAAESLLDPVNKFRVSEPQNLIDTDFEYGLQPTKWETIELVDNIPSVYAQNPAVSIGEIQSVVTTANSDIVTVNCGIAHELSTGDPIEVQGTDSRTANGKYLVTAIISSTSFTYTASAIQASNLDIKTAYTTVIPGSFFSGSNILFDESLGIETDDASPSTISFTTDYTHGLTNNTSVYITNTVGKRISTLSNTSATAPDGEVGVNTTTDTIYLPGHNLYSGQLVYVSADTVANPSATLPSVSNTPNPPSVSASSLQSVYDSVKAAADTIKSTMGVDWCRIYHNYAPSGQYAYYCSAAQYIAPQLGDSNSSYQDLTYGDYGNGYYNFLRIYNSAGSSYYTYQFNPLNSGQSRLYTGGVIDLGQLITYNSASGSIPGTTSVPANLPGRGINYISTLYNYNQYSDYIIQITQVPDPSIIWGGNPNATRVNYLNQSWPSKGAYTYDGYSTFFSNNPISLTSGWVYTYQAVYRPAGFRTGLIKLNIQLENSGWAGYNNSSTSSWSTNFNFNSTPALSSPNYGVRGTNYQIEVLFQLRSYTSSVRYGSTGTVMTMNQMLETVVNRVVNDNFKPIFTNPTGINTVRVVPDGGNRIKLRDVNRTTEFDFTSTGTGPIKVETQQTSGINDNVYSITSTTNTTASISVPSRIAARQLPFVASSVKSTNIGTYLYFPDGHGLKNAQKVNYYVVSGNDIGGLSSGATYYAITLNHQYLGLASTKINAEANNNAITSVPASGSYRIDILSLSGRVAGTGLVGLSTSTKIVTGSGTKFLTTYKPGDKFVITGIGTLANFIENVVGSVVNDTSLSLINNAGITTSDTNHFVDTKINVRADGSYLHRPFDGGVEITAGRSPNSQIVRQTRKYFRYQSGKGIQCSVAINFNPYRSARSASGSGTTATITTEYPHGLTNGNTVKVRGASDSAYNGTFTVSSVTTFTFTYTTSGSITSSSPTGFIEYVVGTYSNAAVRCGLFDFQNGFFYEYDGSTLYAVRRSSTQQLSGTCITNTNSNVINGTNSRFQDQLSVGDMVVIRGQSYKITSLPSQTEMHIQPTYRGLSATSVVITKTVDTKIPQSQWNVDKADGTGPSGYNLNINNIQMAYFDYSWYGAGKIRFGFKDTYGHVKYMHEFIHNNRLNEAYMRSGNIPARYEIINTGTPTYIPSLFHWGTSVIMDGRFDDDDSYLFTASGKTLTFTNGDSTTAATITEGSLYTPNPYVRLKNYYLKLTFATANASKFTAGVALYTTDSQLNGQTVSYTDYSGGAFNVYVLLSTGYTAPAIYPNVPSGTTVSIGAPSSASSLQADLSGYVPLLSIRLAPSADNNLIGSIGERDIINRMQLKLQEMGISVTHDVIISVILNPNLSNLEYQNVGSPSLSQYIPHESTDTVGGGTVIYSFRASGGTENANGKRFSQSSTFDLTALSDLGNSILGGDGVFPNGPDVITIAATVVNTSEIDAESSFSISSRISWAESQA